MNAVAARARELAMDDDGAVDGDGAGRRCQPSSGYDGKQVKYVRCLPAAGSCVVVDGIYVF